MNLEDHPAFEQVNQLEKEDPIAVVEGFLVASYQSTMFRCYGPELDACGAPDYIGGVNADGTHSAGMKDSITRGEITQATADTIANLWKLCS